MGPFTEKHLTIILTAFCLFYGSVCAQEQEEERVKPENGMYLLWAIGDLIESRDPENREVVEHEWINQLVGGLIMNSYPVDNMRLTINFEIATYNIYPRKPGEYDGEGTNDTKFDAYIEESKGVYTFGKTPPTSFEIEFGYFLMRYNKSARVFGEYLFRSMIYPSIVFNNFDNPWVPLSGLRIGHDITENFHHDLFILSEIDHHPYFDFTVGYLAQYNLFNLAEIGAGVNFKSLIPVRPSITTPDIPDNVYIKIPAQGSVPVWDDTGLVVDTLQIDTELEGFVEGRTKLPTLGDSLVTGNFDNKHLLSGIAAERTVYSFQGTIFMGRLSVFPLGMMGSEEMKKMVSLYSEAAVLGWKNYAYFYENRSERIPIMGGIQFSIPKIIDILAFEVEHFGSKAPPTYWKRGHESFPQPGGKYSPKWDAGDSVLTAEADRLSKDNWKWMIYARKQFKGWAVALQTGTDHMRRGIETEAIAYDEILTRPSQWYWQLRIRIPY